MTAGNTVGSSVSEQTVTIASGGTESTKFSTGEYTQGTISFGAITGTALAPQFSNDGANWTAVGSALVVAANGTTVIPADVFKAKYGRFVMDAQAAARTLILFLKG